MQWEGFAGAHLISRRGEAGEWVGRQLLCARYAQIPVGLFLFFFCFFLFFWGVGGDRGINLNTKKKKKLSFLGNMESDHPVFLSDVLFARLLRNNNFLLWYSPSCRADLGQVFFYFIFIFIFNLIFIFLFFFLFFSFLFFSFIIFFIYLFIYYIIILIISLLLSLFENQIPG